VLPTSGDDNDDEEPDSSEDDEPLDRSDVIEWVLWVLGNQDP